MILLPGPVDVDVLPWLRIESVWALGLVDMLETLWDPVLGVWWVRRWPRRRPSSRLRCWSFGWRECGLCAVPKEGATVGALETFPLLLVGASVMGAVDGLVVCIVAPDGLAVIVALKESVALAVGANVVTLAFVGVVVDGLAVGDAKGVGATVVGAADEIVVSVAFTLPLLLGATVGTIDEGMLRGELFAAEGVVVGTPVGAAVGLKVVAFMCVEVGSIDAVLLLVLGSKVVFTVGPSVGKE